MISSTKSYIRVDHKLCSQIGNSEKWTFIGCCTVGSLRRPTYCSHKTLEQKSDLSQYLITVLNDNSTVASNTKLPT